MYMCGLMAAAPLGSISAFGASPDQRDRACAASEEVVHGGCALVQGVHYEIKRAGRLGPKRRRNIGFATWSRLQPSEDEISSSLHQRAPPRSRDAPPRGSSLHWCACRTPNAEARVPAFPSPRGAVARTARVRHRFVSVHTSMHATPSSPLAHLSSLVPTSARFFSVIAEPPCSVSLSSPCSSRSPPPSWRR